MSMAALTRGCSATARRACSRRTFALLGVEGRYRGVRFGAGSEIERDGRRRAEVCPDVVRQELDVRGLGRLGGQKEPGS